MSTVGAIGIDLGGSTAVVAISKRAGVEIVTNEASQRETPVCVGFGQNERFIGEQAYTQLKSNFKNTVLFPNRLLGVKPDAPFLNEEKKWLFSPLALTEDNRIAYEITVRGQKQLILPEQAIAMFLQKLKQFVANEGVLSNDMVVSVPGYVTEQEKKALLDAARVAKINVTKIMSEPTAIAAGYGMFRRLEFGSNPRNVLFIDLGHCKTSAFVASFTKDKVSVLNQVHERNLGVRDFDWKLLEFYADMVQKKYGSNIMNKEKPRLRLLDAIGKQRKILSANSEATLSVDNIVEDEDLSYNLTRDNFEQIITPILKYFQNALLQLRSEIKVPIHSVEIIGGGTRIPIVQKIIQDVFKCECLRTLNASECVARGCAIQSVLLNPLYKGAPYTIEDSNYYPIACSWTFKHDVGTVGHHQYKNDPNKQIALLFPKGAPIPCAKGLTFHRDANIDVRLFYADPAPPGADQLIAQYYIHGQKAKTQEFGIKIVVALNKHGISELESAKLLEDVYEDKLAPGSHRAQSRGGFGGGFMGGMGSFWPGSRFQEQEEEVKRKKQTYSADLKAEVSNFNVMDQRLIDELADYENKMAHQDRLIQETYDKRNELEAYVYDVRNKVNDKYDKYLRPEFKANILQNLNDVEAWLYGGGANASKIEYQAKLDQLRAVVSSIEKRYKDFEMIPQYISQFANNLTSTEQLLTQGGNVSEENKAQLLETINNNKGWLEEVNRRINTTSRMDDPPVSSDEIQNRMREFMNVRTTGGLA